MDTDPKTAIRRPDAPSPSQLGGGRADRVNRRLVAAVAALCVALVGLGVWLVAQRASGTATPGRPAAVSSVTPTTGATEPDPAFGARIAGSRITLHVDESMSAYRRGDMDHFLMGYSGSGGFSSRSYFRFVEAVGRMVRVNGVLALVGTRDVERISPVIVVAKGTEGDGTWTVVFSVRAGADEQLWIQHWATPWGETLQQMWVIPMAAGPPAATMARLTGVWRAGSADWPEMSRLVLTDCRVGEHCGRVVRFDAGERCVYPLVLSSGDTRSATFKTAMGTSFNCAWSGWSNAVVRVTIGADDSIQLGHPGDRPENAITLNRVEE